MIAKRNNRAAIAPLGIILASDVHSAANAFEKRAWPHSPRDGDAPTNIGEVKQAVAELDAADIIAHEHGTASQLIARHTALPDTQKGAYGVDNINVCLQRLAS